MARDDIHMRADAPDLAPRSEHPMLAEAMANERDVLRWRRFLWFFLGLFFGAVLTHAALDIWGIACLPLQSLGGQ